MLLTLLLLQATPETMVAEARARTRAEIQCAKAADPAEITVCGQREADKRFRVSFVTTDPRDAVFSERTRLMRNPNLRCGISGPFLVGEVCGMVGVTMTTGGGNPTTIKPRDLAR